VGNIIHEASHHYGTKDLAYGILDGLSWLIFFPFETMDLSGTILGI
jgi:hypothetical protein